MPYYLHIGMTPSDYWNGEAYLCVAYREKAKLDAKLQDAMAWQNGAYFYESLVNLSPIFGFNKGQTKEYPRKPHAYEESSGNPERDKQRKIQSGKAFMERFTAAHNAAMKQKENAPST